MDVGVTAFLTDRSMTPSALAMAAEERGYHSLYFPEHTHLPVRMAAPPSVVAGVRPEDYQRGLDPFASLAAASTVTGQIRLGTGVALVAQHDPVTLAKTVATIDHLSGGRFILGVGYGWNRAEAEDHGVAFASRRALLREHMLCMQALWDAESATPAFHGEFIDLPPCYAWPKTVQQPRVRTLIGGAPGPKLFAAIAEFGDGWMPIGSSGIGAALPVLRQELDAVGRDPKELNVVPFGVVPDPGKLGYLAEIGVTEVVLRVPGGTSDEMLPTLDDYARFIDL